jgi:hypothetical protein
MNKQDREQLSKFVEQIEGIKIELEEMRDSLQERADNILEKFPSKSEKQEEEANSMDRVIDCLNEAIDDAGYVGDLAHVVNECCKESIDGVWLVIEETVARVYIEVRFMERLERNDLCSRVFSYVDNTPGCSQKVGRRGTKNENVLIEVEWTMSAEYYDPGHTRDD